jgi:hypothetical protein
VIDLSARTAKPEGHEPVPLKRSVEDEDIVAFASPKASDDVLDGRLNRITGEALIHFLTDPMYEFHGRCHRAESLFEKPHERWGRKAGGQHCEFTSVSVWPWRVAASATTGNFARPVIVPTFLWISGALGPFLQPENVRENWMTEVEIHEHHEQAAQHYEHAAKHHREAAKHHRAGNHEKAAHHARIAFGHYLEAAEHQNHAARQHAKMHS